MTVTASDIQALFTEFASVATPLIDEAIAQIDTSISENFNQEFRDRLIRLGTAHILTLIERGKLKTQGMIGQVQQGKEAKISMSDEDYWQQSEYGQLFWNLLQSTGGVGIITV